MFNADVIVIIEMNKESKAIKKVPLDKIKKGGLISKCGQDKMYEYNQEDAE